MATVVQSNIAAAGQELSGDLLGAGLRDVIAALDRAGDLQLVEGADWNLELGAITEMKALRDGPALLFDSVKGYPAGYRVLTNVTNSPRRVALLLGMSQKTRGIDLVRELRNRLNNIQLLDPVEVTEAEFQEETRRGSDLNLFEFPAPLWHELDGGRYLGTAGLVITRDPDEGWVNAGTYRVQVHDASTLGLFVEPSHHAKLMLRRYWEKGETAPVAVVIGVQTGVLMSGFLGVPWGVSEFRWAGGLMGAPVRTVKGEVTGLPIPASAEIVIEGFCPPPTEEARTEGPFGETIGYYASGARSEPVIRVELIQHRRDPVLVGAPPLRPPASSSASYLFRSANLWNDLERTGIPGIQGVWNMPSGSSSLLSVISLKQRYGGHAQQIGTAAVSHRASGGLGRLVILVDDDIDPSDQDQVLWAVATRCDPEIDIDIVRNATTNHLDPLLPPEKRQAGNFTGSRAIINACRPYHWMKDFPPVVGTSPELQAKILKDWPNLFPS